MTSLTYIWCVCLIELVRDEIDPKIYQFQGRIFSYLSVNTLFYGVERVCRRWRLVAQQEGYRHVRRAILEGRMTRTKWLEIKRCAAHLRELYLIFSPFAEELRELVKAPKTHYAANREIMQAWSDVEKKAGKASLRALMTTTSTSTSTDTSPLRSIATTMRHLALKGFPIEHSFVRELVSACSGLESLSYL